jgi:hypothetical protein
MRTWVYNPHVGGVKISPAVRLRTEQRIRAYAETHYRGKFGKFNRLDIRFRGVLCYIDAYIEPRQTVPLHLCRLRYFGNEKAWTMAFYTYSGKKYEPCVFGNGTFHADWKKLSNDPKFKTGSADGLEHYEPGASVASAAGMLAGLDL